MTEGKKTVAYKDLPPLDPETAVTMNEEFNISTILSIIYYIFLLAVTILNWAAKDLMKFKLWGGMSLTWFATSIFAMFMAFGIAWLHVYFYHRRFARQVSASNSKGQGVV